MKPRKSNGVKLPPRKRILIVDDHPLMREGLRSVINREPDLTVCGAAENAAQALAAVEKLAPDLALVDITLPGRSGLELIKDLNFSHPKLGMLAISMHDEQLYAERALHAGAGGYITKEQPPEELLAAIRQILNSKIYVSQNIAANIIRRAAGRPVHRPQMQLLTDREFEVFQSYGAGRSPKEIAKQLHLSVKTVAVYNSNIRHKLKLQSTAQMVRCAVLAEGKVPVRD